MLFRNGINASRTTNIDELKDLSGPTSTTESFLHPSSLSYTSVFASPHDVGGRAGYKAPGLSDLNAGSHFRHNSAPAITQREDRGQVELVGLSLGSMALYGDETGQT